jgi:hypothetical protein
MRGFLQSAHQSSLTAVELKGLAKQLDAAEIRLAVARKELENHDLQRRNARETEQLMRNKTTQEQLYAWMADQTARLYFQSYQLAFDLARKAERAFRYELGVQEAAFVRAGQWDSRNHGLLAGEQLSQDLKRMEAAFLDRNRRDHELVKHVSLAQIDPVQLIRLRQTGECDVVIPEALFDLDCPGHFQRRIKSVGLTIPCVTGPFTAVNCVLTLTSSKIRMSAAAGTEYAESSDGTPDVRFAYNFDGTQSIVTSGAQSDTGLFETNLRDERFLPFEGAGAVSAWKLQLPSAEMFPQFDYSTISDVVLHIRYTARDGGPAFRGKVEQKITELINQVKVAGEGAGLFRMYSLRHEFPNEWHAFVNNPNNNRNTVTLPVTHARYPFVFRGSRIDIGKVELYISVKPDFTGSHNTNTVKVTFGPGSTPSTTELALAIRHKALAADVMPANEHPREWTLSAWRDAGNEEPLAVQALEDIWIVFNYSVG